MVTWSRQTPLHSFKFQKEKQALVPGKLWQPSLLTAPPAELSLAPGPHTNAAPLSPLAWPSWTLPVSSETLSCQSLVLRVKGLGPDTETSRGTQTPLSECLVRITFNNLQFAPREFRTPLPFYRNSTSRGGALRRGGAGWHNRISHLRFFGIQCHLRGRVRGKPYPDVEVPLRVACTDLKGIVGAGVDGGCLDLEHISGHAPL